jgi:hydroxymethylpyrimidine/phosphomethylpyrimidine kinase
MSQTFPSQQILSIGMSDSSAGTGIQADIKTIYSLGGYASTVITALSIQDSEQVVDTFLIPSDLVKNQLNVIVRDQKPSVIKTGMLGCEDTINIVGDYLDSIKDQQKYVVIDPVMTSRKKQELLDKKTRDALKRRLLIYADILTPNIYEARDLTGLKIQDLNDMKHAAEMLMTLGCRAVLIKGGGIKTEKAFNVYADEDGIVELPWIRRDTRATHGAGTTLAAAIACGLAQGLSLAQAAHMAHAYLNIAIDRARSLSSGFGAVEHFYAGSTHHVMSQFES